MIRGSPEPVKAASRRYAVAYGEPGPNPDHRPRTQAAARTAGKEWLFLLPFPQVREFRIYNYGLDQSGSLTVNLDGNVPSTAVSVRDLAWGFAVSR